MQNTIVEIIQAMLVPGLMVSACGLLLLGMNNKYSMIVNRIRLLNQEDRSISPEKNSEGQNRHVNIELQLSKLFYRLKLVRNAVFFYSVAIASFIVSSLFIGLKFLLDSGSIEVLIVIFFLLGMLFVLCGIILAANEVLRGYQIIKIEITRSTKDI